MSETGSPGLEKLRLVNELGELADILEIGGADSFRVRAFRSGARALEAWQGDLAALVDAGEVTSIKGIGKKLGAIIEDRVRGTSGSGSAEAAEIRALVPEPLIELLGIPGIGPKKVRALWEGLGIVTLNQLEKAAQEGRVRELKGFGEKSEADILAGIEQLRHFSGRFLVPTAEAAAARFIDVLRAAEGVERVEVAGSLRRRRETIGDIDLLVAAEDGAPARAAFLATPGVSAVEAEGEKKCRVVAEEGIGVDLRIVAPEEFATALHHFTGSKEHNTHLRLRAKERGLKLNEYGLWREDGSRLEVREEDDVFRSLGLAPIPPELREDLGEIEAAEGVESLPELVTLDDLRGTLHCHSTWSDGRSTLREMVEGAIAHGWKVFGIADHSRTPTYAGGLSIERLREQCQEVQALREEFPGIAILHGTESDILADGSLDYPEDVLAELDYVVASVHSGFSINATAQTARIERALRNPFTTVWGHPTGRLLLRRDGYECDVDHLLQVAAEEGVIVELNANPQRLDLDWRWGKRVRELGVEVGIHPDAHSVAGLADVRYGVGVARKMGLGKAQVTNAWPLKRYLARLRTRREKAGIR